LPSIRRSESCQRSCAAPSVPRPISPRQRSPPPITIGARYSNSRSTSPAARKAEAVRAPPSTSKLLQSSCPISCGDRITSQPSGAGPLPSMIRCGLRVSRPGRRTSNAGRSAATVPAPTTMASHRARSRWVCARAASPVIQRLLPSAIAIQPSSDVASFSVTCGRAFSIRHRKPAKPKRASSANKGCATSMPAAFNRANPSPAVRGSGSVSAATTRDGLAATKVSPQLGPRSL
jgi:hypothetical protein